MVDVFDLSFSTDLSLVSSALRHLTFTIVSNPIFLLFLQEMRLKFVAVSVFVFVAMCCVALSQISNASQNENVSQRQQQEAKGKDASLMQEHMVAAVSASVIHADESVLSSRHSNARLRLLADYSRSSVESNDAAASAASANAVSMSQDRLQNSIPATVRPPPPTPSTPRRSTPPAMPPSPPTPKLSQSPVLRFQNTDPRITANIAVTDYVSSAVLSTVFVSKAPADVPFHYESASHVYQMSGTVQMDGATLPLAALVCTEFATVVLQFIQHAKAVELRCDQYHSEPDTVTIVNNSPEEAQITLVDGSSGAFVAQQSLRSGVTANIKTGNPNTVFVAYARIHGVNWRPAGCKYRGTVTISGSMKADGGIKLSCDDEHAAKAALRIINGSGECPVQTSVHLAEKTGSAAVATKAADEFSINCGDTAESFIGATENSYRRISVKMADGSTPSIVCPAGSTVLIGGSGIHC